MVSRKRNDPAEQYERSKEDTDARFRETDERFRQTDVRIQTLVSAMGEWVRPDTRPGPTA